MRSRLRWILVGIVPALCTATAQAEVTRPPTTRPAQIVSAGELYHWRPQDRTYCFENEYDKERCMDRLELVRLRCVTHREVMYL